MKELAVLGSTGSIGRNTLKVALAHPERVRVGVLTAGRNAELLAEQALRHRPRLVAIRDEEQRADLEERLAGTGIRVLAGEDGILEAALEPECDTVMGAIVGGAGLRPVYEALKAGRDVALANKEPLVMAGALMRAAARASGARLLPVDSEHNALFQCVHGEERGGIRRLVLTASGGPFRLTPAEEIADATVEQALAHPTWKMGPKITIDSATLMNKGLEVIEAHFLFDVPADAIDVVIHPKSVVHSLVEFVDGSVLAELGTADMRIPIRYALSYPGALAGRGRAASRSPVGRSAGVLPARSEALPLPGPRLPRAAGLLRRQNRPQCGQRGGRGAVSGRRDSLWRHRRDDRQGPRRGRR